jgi:phytoene dehydrogenase-like protein
MPGNTLHFSNDPRVLEASIQREFPSDIEGFRSFVAAIMVESEKPAPTSDDCFDLLREKIRSARLRDMLALPVLSYGGYREKSIDSRTFAVLFRSIFLEGCCCPKDIKVVLDRLLSRFQELGGHLVRRAPVATIDSADGIATGVTLSDGTRLKAGRLISSVGLHESGRLAGRNWGAPGQVSIFQWVAEYSVPVDNLGVRDTVHFSSSQNVLDWRIPRTRPFVDIATFAALDNYSFPDITNGHFKASFFSHFDEWRNLNEVEYANQKERYSTLAWQATREHYPDLAAASPTVTDAFTPTTVMRYTGHPNGSIYGGETKSFDGRSELKNLFIVGNDQGGIGIMGALTSGVIIVNYNILL